MMNTDQFQLREITAWTMSTKTFFIGNKTLELTPLFISGVSKIFSGGVGTFYVNDDLSSIRVSGSNLWGGCGVEKKEGSNQKLEFEPVTFFQDIGIELKNICVNLNTFITWFISTDGKVYGSGDNINHAINGSNQKIIYIPWLISQLHDVIDIKSSSEHSIALCSNISRVINTIMTFWFKSNSVPSDVQNIIISYYRLTEVYKKNNAYKFGWDEMRFFDGNNHFIVKIAAEYSHSVFLSQDGNVFTCDRIKTPMMIDYFAVNKIRIVDIQCGANHTLAMDEYGRLYAWGDNKFGQCGDGTTKHVFGPKWIESLQEYRIVEIQCGSHFNYCKSECGKHFFWGANRKSHQCVLMDGDAENNNNYNVLKPHMLDEKMLLDKYGIKEIINVFLGSSNTQIVAIV